MRRDVFGVILMSVENQLLFFSSVNTKYSYKYLFCSHINLLFILQFCRFNSLMQKTILNEFTANEHFFMSSESVMTFILTYYLIIPNFNLRMAINS